MRLGVSVVIKKTTNPSINPANMLQSPHRLRKELGKRFRTALVQGIFLRLGSLYRKQPMDFSVPGRSRSDQLGQQQLESSPLDLE